LPIRAKGPGLPKDTPALWFREDPCFSEFVGIPGPGARGSLRKRLRRVGLVVAVGRCWWR
jgi:hypothetical protein